jgi:hypothetical protein
VKSNNYTLVHVRRCLPHAASAFIAFVFAVSLRALFARSAEPTFTLAEAPLSSPPAFVVYGDTRFTNWQLARNASSPWARQALVQKIASEHPEALFITGDIPFRGADFADYKIFKSETKAWAAAHLPVFPILGNHEFYERDFIPSERRGLENWWRVFPNLQARRWYSVEIGSQIYVLCLDSNCGALRQGTPQRAWLRQQLAQLPDSVQYVFCLLHHDRIGDYLEGHTGAARLEANGELDSYLEHEQQRLHARIVVISGHVHNYGRFERNGVIYIISGGGGAHPVFFRRRADDRFRGKDLTYMGKALPNYNFVRFEHSAEGLTAVVERISNPLAAGGVPSWDTPDQFAIPSVHP